MTESRPGTANVRVEERLADHARSCPKCRTLADDWRLLRKAAAGLAAPALSPAVESGVRRLCRAELDRLAGTAPAASPPPVKPLPGFFWPAFGALLCLTVFTLIPGLEDIIRGGTWTIRTTLALVLVVQNVLMLLFAPLLLLRRPANGTMCG